MAGNTRELDWGIVSDIVHRRLGRFLEFLLLSENEYQELLILWALHGNDDQLVADQLFSGTADAKQLAMTIDLKDSLLAAHDIWTALDSAVTIGPLGTAIRSMT